MADGASAAAAGEAMTDGAGASVELMAPVKEAWRPERDVLDRPSLAAPEESAGTTGAPPSRETII
jgi:hypothetical protein